MPRDTDTLKILDDLHLLYSVLNQLIVEYEFTTPWVGQKIMEVTVPDSWKITTDQKYLYVCQWSGRCVSRYTLDTLKLVDQFKFVSYASAIDILGNELYVYEWNVSLKVIDINTTDIIRQWIPMKTGNAMKIYDGNLYYLASEVLCIYNLEGKFIKQFGKKGVGNGEFDIAHGIDIDSKFIYIADLNNARIQVLHLGTFTYSHQWGKRGVEDGLLTDPFEVRLYCTFCCVGDLFGIQIFTKDGSFLSRLSNQNQERQFHRVLGLVMVNDRLYVSEDSNDRLSVWQ